MVFAQFYKWSTGYVKGSIPPRYDGEKAPIWALGDRGTIILDGRRSLSTHIRIAEDECRKRGFIGFSIHTGKSLLQNHPMTNFRYIDGLTGPDPIKE